MKDICVIEGIYEHCFGNPGKDNGTIGNLANIGNRVIV
jgi:hypothetical protein